MRLSNSEHESHEWRICEIVPDFRLEDARALPAQGDLDDFDALLEVITALDPATTQSHLTRALFSIRHHLGRLFGWDRESSVPGRDAAESTLRARLPEDLLDTATGPTVTSKELGDLVRFKPLYRTDVEWAAEISNRTVHGVVHLAWVQKGVGAYQGQMGVYVKPRGRLGAAYMAAIAPFRYLIVYPALMHEVERAWTARVTS
ncbi:MAG: DUF2867 domain-containing protein [Solirubrobacteraceae bacterium]|jgi:hypothetical protein